MPARCSGSGVLPGGPAAGPLGQTVALHRDPLGMLRRLQGQHGEIFTLRLTTLRPLVVVASASEAAELLTADPGSARAGVARRKIVPLASARSMFGADGPAHQAARGRLAPLFAPEAVSRHREAIETIAARHVAAWPRGRPLRLLPRMRALVDEVFVRRMLGVDDDRAPRLAAAIGRMLWTPGNPPLAIPGDGALGTLSARIFARRRAPLTRLLTAVIDERRASGSQGDDIVGRLLGEEPDIGTGELVDELLALVMAAQEPAAAALTWLLARLARDPALAADYRAGAPEATPIAAAIVNETLRLNPPAIAALRRLTAERTVADVTLPAGVVVMLPIPLLQRDPAVGPGPDSFEPRRWLTDAAPSAPYLPFGGGVRRCLGEPLAREYLRTIATAALARVRLRPIWPRPERMVLRGTILVPHRSALVVIDAAT